MGTRRLAGVRAAMRDMAMERSRQLAEHNGRYGKQLGLLTIVELGGLYENASEVPKTSSPNYGLWRGPVRSRVMLRKPIKAADLFRCRA